jgi:hypothetical protein
LALLAELEELVAAALFCELPVHKARLFERALA